MKSFIRNLVLCALPLLSAMGAGYGFTRIQGSCGAMVGALFAAKCAGRQREYQARFQLAGAGFGIVLAASLGTWLEHRRRTSDPPRVVPRRHTSGRRRAAGGRLTVAHLESKECAGGLDRTVARRGERRGGGRAEADRLHGRAVTVTSP